MTQPTQGERKGRILPFRPRGPSLARRVPPAPPPVADLGAYERTPEEPDEYRHRMMVNGLALLATVVLIAAGLWIAGVMAQMRKNQDCVLVGRPGCTPVEVTPQPR